MSTSFQTVVLLVATLIMGLSAGFFYAWACSVMVGLRHADDRTFVSAMQWINLKIINPWFLASFLGAFVLTLLAVVLHLGYGRLLPWIAAAFVLYCVQLALTGGINIPLNNALVAAGDPDKIPDLAAVRASFEDRWVRWNVVRAVTVTAAFGCLAWALALSGQDVTGGV
ncbi:MAG: DUF1772 domain-containing protein [Actinopolymorphaceae bacterium]